MKVLVTGGAGFIGYHTCLELCKQGHEVIILDDLSCGDHERVTSLEKSFPGKVTFFWTDVRNLYMYVENDIDAILHLAAKISVEESFAQPMVTSDINIMGFISVCEFARKNNVKRVIYASSAAVYGNTSYCSESGGCNPISPYGQDKVTNEAYARHYTNLHGIEFVGLRYFNVYGPLQNMQYAGVITKFVSNIENGEPLTIYGDGSQHRNFVYVEDVAKINVHGLNGGFNNYVVNIGSPEGQCTILDLADIIREISGKRTKIVFKPTRDGDIYHSAPNLERLCQSYYPNYYSMEDLTSGLRKMLL